MEDSFSCDVIGQDADIMSRVTIKPVFRQIRRKPSCMVSGLKFRFEEVEGLYYYIYIYVVKRKALVSFAVTVQLICTFVFAYAKSMQVFSVYNSHYQ